MENLCEQVIKLYKFNNLLIFTMDCFKIQVEIPANKCPKIRGRKKLIRDGKAKVLLSNNTSMRRADEGFVRYGVSSGRNAIVLTGYAFKKKENQIVNFLNRRFDRDWVIKLIPVEKN